MTEFNIKKVAVFRVAIFLNKVLRQIYFLGIYKIFNINDSSNLGYKMWIKQGISLDDSNFDMGNYSSLVDVKLLLKRILDSYWNKLLCKFCITVCRFHARTQRWTCTTYEECNNSRANSEIGYATDCLYSFWDRQKAEFCVLYSFVGIIANIYLAEKNWALLTDILNVKKQYVFARQLPHTKTYI